MSVFSSELFFALRVCVRWIVFAPCPVSILFVCFLCSETVFILLRITIDVFVYMYCFLFFCFVCVCVLAPPDFSCGYFLRTEKACATFNIGVIRICMGILRQGHERFMKH